MASDLLWKKDADGIEHPTHEILLAFIREQCSEQEESRIDEHLHTGCVSCNRLHSGLTQDSDALKHLMDVSRYPDYPELQANQVWLHMQRGEALTSAWTGKRKRKFQTQSRRAPVERRQRATRQYSRNTGLRVFKLSFPVAFGLLLLLMTAAIVLAYTIAGLVKPPSAIPRQQANHIYSPAPNPTSVAGHQITPTTIVQVTPSAGTTTTDGHGKGPTIAICPSPGNPGPLIYICGRNFKAGDRVSLVLVFDGMNNPLVWGSYRVNGHGEFTGTLFLYSCRFVPQEVYAKDESLRSASVTSNALSNFPMANCNSSTSGNWPGGHA